MRKNITEVKGKDGDEGKGKKIKKTRQEGFFYVVLIPVDPTFQQTAALQKLSSSGRLLYERAESVILDESWLVSPAVIFVCNRLYDPALASCLQLSYTDQNNYRSSFVRYRTENDPHAKKSSSLTAAHQTRDDDFTACGSVSLSGVEVSTASRRTAFLNRGSVNLDD
jgi:hypothetical protein